MKKTANKPCICSKDNIIYDANNQFLDLTGYKYKEIIGKSLEDISGLLRSESQGSIQEIKENTLYIFTKDNSPLEVTISCESLNHENHKVYYFHEKTDSLLAMLQANFDNIYINPNEAVAIFSFPDCLLLSHNLRYPINLKRMDVDYNNIIGKYAHFKKDILKLFDKKDGFYLDEATSIELGGKETFWDTNGKIIKGEKGKKYFLVSFYEVTDRVEKKQLVDKQKKDMTLILENITDGVNIIDNKGEYIYINKASKEKTANYFPEGTPRNSRMNYDALGLSDINGKPISFKEMPEQRVLRGETLSNHVLIETRHFPMTYHECDGMPIYDEEGNITGGIIVYRDIEDALKVEEYSAFKTTIKDISICYATLSPVDFKIRYINEYAFKNLKKRIPGLHTERQVIGENFFNYYKTEDKDLSEHIEKAIKNHSNYIHKQEFIRAGETKYRKTLFEPTYNKEGQVKKIVVVGIDISDEEIAKRQIQKLLKAQEEMFVNTSHELKTPLNVIFSAAQLLQVDLQSDSIEEMKDGIQACNKIIMQNCYRLTKLINNILDISKIESGIYQLNLADYNIIDIIDDIVASVAAHVSMRGLNIIFDTEVEECIISIDIEKFEKVLLNLISNAIKFSSPGGLIMINLVEQDGEIEISVEDQGLGIDPENFDIIFEKFRQLNTSLSRRSEGTGIGLPLAKSILELHNGHINVESALGQGSKFTIGLPGKVLAIKSPMEDETQRKNRDDRVRLELSDIYA